MFYVEEYLCAMYILIVENKHINLVIYVNSICDHNPCTDHLDMIP